MKQLVQMIRIDLKLLFTNYIGFFILVMPLVLLMVLRFFLPTVGNSGNSFAVVSEGPYAVPESIIEELEHYGSVSRYDSIEDMERRLRGVGEAEGLYLDPEQQQYVSVMERSLEGFTIFSAGSRIIRQSELSRTGSGEELIRFSARIPDELSDRTASSPVATMGGAIYIIYLSLIVAYMIGLGIVNDKEYGTDRAYRVSPVSRTDYFVGKSIFPLFILLAYSALSLPVLGLGNVNLLQTGLVLLLAFTLGMLIALIVGALGKNENEAIGMVKSLGMIMGLGILGGTLLPEAWQWIAWWIPFYWLFSLLEGIFTLTAGWDRVALQGLVLLGLTALYFFILRRRIIRGLS